MDLLKIIENRKLYPLMNKKGSEMDYLFDQLDQNQDKVGLVLPLGFFQTYRDQELRKLLFEEWCILGIFDIGAIWNPLTSVKFNLLILQKQKPEKVIFTQYLSKHTFVSDNKISPTGEIGNQIITQDFSDYIVNIENILSGSTLKTSKNYKIWETKYNQIDLENLQSHFYDPELVENENKLEQEKTEVLENLVDIVKPRKINGSKKGLIIKTKDFIYPLEIDKLDTDDITSLELKKGDILFSDSFAGNQKFYLIHQNYKKGVYSSSFLTIIRPKSDLITPEYLFLYLQSEVIQKYFNRYTTGSVIQRILLKDLKKLPIILPDLSTKDKSKRIFEKLFLIPKDNILEQINKELFELGNISDKPIQKEFVFEKLEELKIWKKEIIKGILEDDFRELELTKKQKMFKSFVILAGSILEAFLTDWLSEEDNYDYFSSEDELILGNLIWKLFSFKEGKYPDKNVYEMANFIRDKRNLIHPKKYFNSKNELNESVCNIILKDLRAIIRKRK